MPGSLQNAVPVAVLPQSLCQAFGHSRDYPVLDNAYRNGESQRSVQAINSRKSWTLKKRLAPALLQALREFYEARNGAHESFYFYDPYETVPRFSGDPSGVETAGRHTVRFHTDWDQLTFAGRSNANAALIEVA
jgi:phage-related protein